MLHTIVDLSDLECDGKTEPLRLSKGGENVWMIQWNVQGFGIAYEELSRNYGHRRDLNYQHYAKNTLLTVNKVFFA